MKDSTIDYIFLSRFLPLPLSALRIINETISFNEIMNSSENNFKKFLIGLKNTHKIPIKNIEYKLDRFRNRNNEEFLTKITTSLELCRKNEIIYVSYFDKGYPPVLKLIKSPPKFIFMKGQLKPEDNKAVAIIGTREPTDYGKKMTIEISKILAQKGFTIVSGFARGVDTIALKSALENGGRGIGVLPCGILNIYPPENKDFVEQLVKNGVLFSEMFPEDNVTTRALQMRNKITSGFGLGNIFVEGTESSGTKWQMKFGKQQDRPAIAVKPTGDYKQAHIPNKVIEEGGEIIADLEDLNYIEEVLMSEYEGRVMKLKEKKQTRSKQTNLFKF